MTNGDLLRKIHRDNKAINRKIQRIANIALIGVLGNAGREAKKNDDEVEKTIVKTGLLVIALTEILLLIGDIIDLLAPDDYD